jgi:hypothetical protein
MLEYHSHALERAAQRGISEEQIEHAWNHPKTATVPGRRPDTLQFVGTLPSGGQISIVVDKNDRRRIITVWLV